MFNRARPDKETEGIIGREKEKTDRQREKEKKAGKRISRGKTVSPRSSRATRETLQDDSSKTAPGPRCNWANPDFWLIKVWLRDRGREWQLPLAVSLSESGIFPTRLPPPHHVTDSLNRWSAEEAAGEIREIQSVWYMWGIYLKEEEEWGCQAQSWERRESSCGLEEREASDVTFTATAPSPPMLNNLQHL